ncbi:MAG: hypothetical protein QM493_12010 [Sulfurovum sp.]
MKLIVTTLLLSLSLMASSGVHWQKVEKKFKPIANTSSYSGHKSPKYELIGLKDNAKVEVDYYLSTLEKKKVEYKSGGVALPKSGYDTYHALVANIETPNALYSATTYIFKHGRPSPVSPTKLTSLNKSKFEIRPILLPREHDRYTADQKYGFRLYFDDKIVANQSISFVTSNGTKIDTKSDKNAELQITMPSDFKDVKNSRRGNKPANFILSSSYQKDNKMFHTTLTMPYHINPNNHWQSQLYGLLVMFLGMIFGLFIYRRVKNG